MNESCFFALGQKFARGPRGGDPAKRSALPFEVQKKKTLRRKENQGGKVKKQTNPKKESQGGRRSLALKKSNQIKSKIDVAFSRNRDADKFGCVLHAGYKHTHTLNEIQAGPFSWASN